MRHPDSFYIGGQWVTPSTDATIDVVEAATEQLYFRVAEAKDADMDAAIGAAREAFDHGPWPRLSHAERAGYLRAISRALTQRLDDLAQIFPRESGVIFTLAQSHLASAPHAVDAYADMATEFPWEERATPTNGGNFGLLVHEPVGVVGAIIPWNAPMQLIAWKSSPALLAGCTMVIKASPEAPGSAYLMAEIAEQVGLPDGVLNIVTADREASEQLVRDPRVDKISFTGSTATGRRIGSLCGERVARCTLELGGKSAAVILNDADIASAATHLALSEITLTGQACNSLTRIVVPRARHDEMVEALAAVFSAVRVGDPFAPDTQMGPLATERQRDRVEGYISRGIEEGAELVTGGHRPTHLNRGWFIEPTLFARVDNSTTIAREEIFGPVLAVIPAVDEEDAVNIANDSIYGLNASVFTNDPDRARAVARQLRAGTVGHNAKRVDFGIAFGGFKQSGVGREGGREGLLPYLETKTIILDAPPQGMEHV
jgi:acyl-CoA reductase-like NAD-dependent aldehyde dehydrogenase